MPDAHGEPTNPEDLPEVPDGPAPGAIRLPNLLVQLQQETLNDGTRWFGADIATNVNYIAICLGGEAGEVLNEVKKHIRGDSNVNQARFNVAMELVDVLIYLLQLGALMNVDLYEVYKQKREINERRFGGRQADAGDGTAADAGTV